MEELARTTYDRFAPIYDDWNVQNDYEMWLGAILLPELEKHGLRRGRALDVGCGTGRAFPPLLTRGWQVIGCDLSSEMLAEADRKFNSQVRLLNLDARSLPPISPLPGIPPGGAFELILLLNDVVNYAIEPDELRKILAGIKQNLCSDQGLVIFDANTLRLFREDYAAGTLDERGSKGWKWRGVTEGISSGGVFEALLSGDCGESQLHRQRHWPPKQVEMALEEAGLRAFAVLGQREESGRIVLAEEPDENRDRKVVYIAGHAG